MGYHSSIFIDAKVTPYHRTKKGSITRNCSDWWVFSLARMIRCIHCRSQRKPVRKRDGTGRAELNRVVKYIYHTRVHVVQFEPESYLGKTIIDNSEAA